jgi:hypothetical protein
LNALATALLRKTETPQVERAVALLRQAHALSPRYVPASLNLALLFDQDNQPHIAAAYQEAAREALESQPNWSDLDGVLLPLGFSDLCITHANVLAEAVGADDITRLAEFMRPTAAATSTHSSS